jgi:hypothetical protein
MDRPDGAKLSRSPLSEKSAKARLGAELNLWPTNAEDAAASPRSTGQSGLVWCRSGLVDARDLHAGSASIL